MPKVPKCSMSRWELSIFQEKTIQKPRFPHFNPGFPKSLGGNPGFLMQPEFRIFKVRFSSEWCRNREKKDKVKIQET